MSVRRVRNLGNNQIGTVTEEQELEVGAALLGGEIHAKKVDIWYVEYEELDEDHPARKGWAFPHMLEEIQ